MFKYHGNPFFAQTILIEQAKCMPNHTAESVAEKIVKAFQLKCTMYTSRMVFVVNENCSALPSIKFSFHGLMVRNDRSFTPILKTKPQFINVYHDGAGWNISKYGNAYLEHSYWVNGYIPKETDVIYQERLLFMRRFHCETLSKFQTKFDEIFHSFRYSNIHDVNFIFDLRRDENTCKFLLAENLQGHKLERAVVKQLLSRAGVILDD